jgi:hypothetical protein
MRFLIIQSSPTSHHFEQPAEEPREQATAHSPRGTWHYFLLLSTPARQLITHHPNNILSICLHNERRSSIQTGVSPKNTRYQILFKHLVRTWGAFGLTSTDRETDRQTDETMSSLYISSTKILLA